MAKRRKAKRTAVDQHGATPGENQSNELYVSKYEITTEPIHDRSYIALPEAAKAAVQRLHGLAKTNPRAAIPELLAAIAQYPQVPVLYNYLALAYAAVGDIERSETVILEDFRLHPDYLFARTNYAELCLRRGEHDKVPEILGDRLDLKQLCPRRSRFHVSEVVGFYGVVGYYYWAIGRPDEAAVCYDLLCQIDPQHKMTQRLKAKVQPNWWQRLLGGR